MAIDIWWGGLWAVYLWDTLIAWGGWWGGGDWYDIRWGDFWAVAFWSGWGACPCKYTIWDYTFFPVYNTGPDTCNAGFWMLAYNNADCYFVSYNNWFSCRYPLCGFCVWIYCDKYPGVYFWNRSCIFWSYYNTDTCCRLWRTSGPDADCKAEVLRWWTSGSVNHCGFTVCRRSCTCWWQFVYVKRAY